MRNEEIFELAETHGWLDDFGRWNFKDDGLIAFALAISEAEKTMYVDSSRLHKGILEHKPGMVITKPVSAIAEAEKQEPVAWREVAGKTTHYYDYNEQGRGEPLYLSTKVHEISMKEPT